MRCTSCVLYITYRPSYIPVYSMFFFQCYVAEVQSRLQHLLENLPKCCPIPLVMMCPAGSPVTEQNLNMELFLQEDMISGYKFVTVTEDVDNPEYHKKVSYFSAIALNELYTYVCVHL